MHRIDHTPGADRRDGHGMTRAAWLERAAAAVAGAGAGLLAWLALSSALLHGRGIGLQRLLALQAAALGLAVVLAACVIPALLRAPPGRVRSHARGAWSLVLGSGLALLALRVLPEPAGAWMAPLAAVACLASLVGIATLPWLGPDPPPASSLRLPLQLVLGLLGGASLLFALIALFWPGPMPAAAPLPSVLLLGTMALLLLLAHWHRTQGGLRAALASGGWQVLGLLVALPWLLGLALYLDPRWARLAWPLVAVSVLAGSVLAHLGRGAPGRR